MQNRKILIVSYLFPPNGGIAVQRALSFAKYLPRLGYEVHVLTAQNASGPVRDPGLMMHIPPEVTVHHAFAPEVPFRLRQKIWALLAGRSRKAKPASEAAGKVKHVSLPARLIRRVLCPEPEILWVPFALRKLRRLVRELGIGTVLITVPPFSALLAGTKLKREFPSINFISDFRDEWLSFYLKDFEFQSGDHTRRRAERIERECIEASGMVVAVTPTSLDEIRRRYPEQPDSKFVCVPNGYDPEVFANVRPPLQRSNCPKDCITITHVGTVYSTATPKYFLDAVDAMPDDIRSKLTIEFIGRTSESERRTLESRTFNVKVLGFMPQGEALKRVEHADYLLLNMTNDISLPGKLFEYFATGKPILALSPLHGEVGRIIDETGTGWCVSPYDAAAIQRMVLRALDRVKSGAGEFPVNWEKIRQYERPRLAKLLSDLMRERLS